MPAAVFHGNFVASHSFHLYIIGHLWATGALPLLNNTLTRRGANKKYRPDGA